MTDQEVVQTNVTVAKKGTEITTRKLDKVAPFRKHPFNETTGDFRPHPKQKEFITSSNNGLKIEWTPPQGYDSQIAIEPEILLGGGIYQRDLAEVQQQKVKEVNEEAKTLISNLLDAGETVTYRGKEFDYATESTTPINQMTPQEIAIHAIAQGISNAPDAVNENMPDTYFNPAKRAELKKQGIADREKDPVAKGTYPLTTRRSISYVRKPASSKDSVNSNLKYLVVDKRTEVTETMEPHPLAKDDEVKIPKAHGTAVVEIRWMNIDELNQLKRDIKAAATPVKASEKSK